MGFDHGGHQAIPLQPSTWASRAGVLWIVRYCLRNAECPLPLRCLLQSGTAHVLGTVRYFHTQCRTPED